MTPEILEETCAIFALRLGKPLAAAPTMEALVEHFRRRIEAHPVARLICVFDHYAHTAALAEGEIAPEIIAAKNIVFCFGTAIPRPEALALRPRSIGIAETRDGFVVSFLEAPMPLANSAMESWALELTQA